MTRKSKPNLFVNRKWKLLTWWTYIEFVFSIFFWRAFSPTLLNLIFSSSFTSVYCNPLRCGEKRKMNEILTISKVRFMWCKVNPLHTWDTTKRYYDLWFSVGLAMQDVAFVPKTTLREGIPSGEGAGKNAENASEKMRSL